MRLPSSPAGSPAKDRLVAVGVLVVVALALFYYRGSEPVEIDSGARLPTRLSVESQQGRELAKTVCASCHLFPEPELLDKVAWGMEVLPAMAKRLGMTEFNYEDYPGGDRIKAAHIVPDTPTLTVEQWRAVCGYYLESAPTQALPQGKRPEIQVGLKHFQVIQPEYRRTSTTTLVKIDPIRTRIYVGEAATKKLEILNATGKTEAVVTLDSPPASLQVHPKELRLTLMGSYVPSDELLGKVVTLGKPKETDGQLHEVLGNLPRPVDTLYADLNGDGREDIIVCGYGNELGRFSWFENRAGGTYAEHVLLDRSGAIKAYVQDFDHDGKPDLIVMMAQAREGLYLFFNKGNGQFEQKTLMEWHPAWGASYFELADFNGDGFPDILATNGDNGDQVDHVAPFKNYHGIRIYLNDGKNNFHEAYFFPMNGAYKAMARDFDGDGDLDIAAISFYPDYRHSPRESFVYLENLGQMRFTPYSFAESFSGRWLVMDVGDLDGDGKPDIVLGAYDHGPTYVPHTLYEEWEKRGPSLLILKNTGR